MRVLELFGGIGACTNALKRIGVDVEVADYVEIDKYAVASYNAINGTSFEPQDICKWDKDIEVDLIMHGSPCQDFSIAGKQIGGDEGSGTRSSLMYETLRIVEKLKPKYVIWENVKNLLSNKHKHNFDKYLSMLEDLGYNSYYQVLNAKDYGIPQNRERVFTVSIRNDIDKQFIFPKKQELEIRLKDILESEVDEKYYMKDKPTINNIAINNNEHKGVIVRNQGKEVVKSTEIASTLMARDYKGFGNQEMTGVIRCIQVAQLYGTKREPNPQAGRVYDKEGLSPTMDTCSGGNRMPKVLSDDFRVRRLTPKECWRLMGFLDEDFEKAQQVNSNTQLYKQAGNSIVVNVLIEIFRSLLEAKVQKNAKYE